MGRMRWWAAAALAAPIACFAQAFPAKPIRIVAAEVGGASDFTARLVAQGISGPLGESVIVENRGGTGVIEIGRAHV